MCDHFLEDKIKFRGWYKNCRNLPSIKLERLVVNYSPRKEKRKLEEYNKVQRLFTGKWSENVKWPKR